VRRLLLAAVLLMTACEAPAATPSPTAEPVVFWDADTPQVRGPSAFTPLPPERQASRVLRINAYQLSTTLPTAPPTLNVYMAGGYPDADKARVSRFNEPGWDFVPFFSLVQFDRAGNVVPGGAPPLGPVLQAPTETAALARAEAVLRPRGLLPADTQLTRVVRQRDGWRITFARRIDGRITYTNKGAIAYVDANGQVFQVLIRRRPLREQSAYPTRTAQEAWTLAQAGRWLTFNLEDGAPLTPGTVDRFMVKSVDIVYVEGEVLTERDPIRPYYVFRDMNDQTIYVSAIANDGP